MNPLLAARRATTARLPSAEAVTDGKTALSWRALDAEVDGLAGALAAAGVAEGDRVGLLADRSVGTVVGVHAVLRCGATLVPLDPGHPPARLRLVVEDAQLSAIVTQSAAARRHRGSLRSSALPTVDLAARGPAPPLPDVVPEAPACILYTSGSTGRPKGVVLSGRAIQSFVDWACNTLQLNASDRVAHLSPLSFDLSTLELFGPATVGACTVVVGPGATMFPASLAQALAHCSVVYTVPSVWMRTMQADLTALANGPLRHIVYAGEPFPIDALARLMAAVPGRPVHNFFGPTETNVCCAHALDQPPTGPVPIGGPACGVRLHIDPESPADPHLGELWVQGPTVMSGYWNRPAQTAAAFATLEGRGTWLRTGDRVKRDANGILHALGRRDAMLKNRGFRLQPEEVEAALRCCEGVADARVRMDGLGLIAELVPHDAAVCPSPRALTKTLRHTLPSYMVPDRWIWVTALPRTPRGKLDRSAPATPS